MRGSLRGARDSLARTAAKFVRDRAEAKRQAFVAVASSHIEAGAKQVGDAIEKSVDDIIGKIPATPTARPLIDSAIQMALFAVFEALSPKPG